MTARSPVLDQPEDPFRRRFRNPDPHRRRATADRPTRPPAVSDHHAHREALRRYETEGAARTEQALDFFEEDFGD